MIEQIIHGDCTEVLKTLPDKSVDCCITSPPYYGLRDYGTGKWIGGDPNCPHKRMTKYSAKTATGHHQIELIGNVGDSIFKTVCPLCGAVREDKQIGLEETPEGYVEKIASVFREVKRVLKDNGTLWLNLGDTYLGKSLAGIPWRTALRLSEDGWYLRQDIIWQKSNPMPESVIDRCTKAHEYIFLMSKKPSYYFDHEAISEPISASTEKRLSQDIDNQRGSGRIPYHEKPMKVVGNMNGLRNKRDVWTVAVAHSKVAHFATFPEDLIEPMVIAGCPVGGGNPRSIFWERYYRRCSSKTQ